MIVPTYSLAITFLASLRIGEHSKVRADQLSSARSFAGVAAPQEQAGEAKGCSCRVQGLRAGQQACQGCPAARAGKARRTEPLASRHLQARRQSVHASLGHAAQQRNLLGSTSTEIPAPAPPLQK